MCLSIRSFNTLCIRFNSNRITRTYLHFSQIVIHVLSYITLSLKYPITCIHPPLSQTTITKLHPPKLTATNMPSSSKTTANRHSAIEKKMVKSQFREL